MLAFLGGELPNSAKAVAQMKKKIEKQKVAPATKRSKITSFIAQQCSSM